MGSKRNLAAVEPRNLARKQGSGMYTSLPTMKKTALIWDAETVHGSLALPLISQRPLPATSWREDVTAQLPFIAAGKFECLASYAATRSSKCPGCLIQRA